MILTKKIFYLNFIIVVGLLTATPFYAQNNKKLDSLFKVSFNQIYTNPDKVIKIGQLIVSESDKNIDYKIKGYKLIADGYSSKRDYQKSLENVIKANELLHLTHNDLLKIVILNKMGIQYHQLKIYDKSIQYLDQAEQLITEYPYRDSIHSDLGKNYVVRGFIYKEKFSCDIAIDFFNRGISELLKSKLKSDYSIVSIAKYNKGNCYLLMSNNKLASENFLQSIEYAKTISAKSLQAFALKGLAQVYTLEGKYSAAISVLNDAASISNGVNDLILNDEIYNGLSQNYLAVNEWDEFKKYNSKYIYTQKLIKQSERSSVSESLGVKENELKSKFSDEATQFYSLIIGLIVFLILIILFFYVVINRKIKEIGIIKKQIYSLQNEKMK
jgi:tetratricopeptide (TPR) repeat protein